MQSGVPTHVLHDPFPGATVHHPVRGTGAVTEILRHDKRNKPYKITFDNGETHHYSMQSAAKFMTDKRLLQSGKEVRTRACTS